MTPIDQQITIAEWRGWNLSPSIANGGWLINNGIKSVGSFWFNPEKTPTFADCINALPDYLHDLNAMHEAEMFLRGSDEEQCHDVVKNRRWHHYEHLLMLNFGIAATASQRAEALLRTIGKWKGE